MAKLYWKVKINGKWTWRTAKVIWEDFDNGEILIRRPEGEE